MLTLSGGSAATTSTLFLEPAPGKTNNTGHPFQFTQTADYTTFMNGIETWATAEAAAQQ
jgi:hypothetical protein